MIAFITSFVFGPDAVAKLLARQCSIHRFADDDNWFREKPHSGLQAYRLADNQALLPRFWETIEREIDGLTGRTERE